VLVALRPDHLLGFCHNDLFNLNLRMRAARRPRLTARIWSRRRHPLF
jgi:hypothetical protein